MKRLFPIFYFCLFLTACSDGDGDPAPAPVAHQVASITSDDSRQDFRYDGEGRIVSWNYSAQSAASSFDYAASYSYPSSSEIAVKASERDAIGQERSYDELIRLNADGNALYSEGVWIYKPTPDEVMKKKYRLDFSYDDASRLTGVVFTEWKIVNDKPEESPMSYGMTLEWVNGELTGCVETNVNGRPALTHEYTLFHGKSAEHNPLTFPVIRPFYNALQLQGVFGQRSEALVATETITDFSGNMTERRYSYDISVSTCSSWIEGYTVTTSSRPDTSYKVTWK